MRPLTATLVLGVACGPPSWDDPATMMTRVDLLTPATTDEARAPLVALLDEAEESAWVALPFGDDRPLADAIVAAWDRGVDVEVITDVDLAASPAITALADAGVPTTLADGDLAYFDFSLNRDVAWASDQALMSHGFVLVDSSRVAIGSHVGAVGDGPRTVLTLSSEAAHRHLWREFNQVFGGVDAVSTTAYSALAKSTTDAEGTYPNERDQALELWFGPQQRATKRMIDAVYGARASVWLVTDDLADEGMVEALETKARLGFDVRVVVGSAFDPAASPLSRLLTTDAPTVAKRRIDDAVVPTVMVVDAAASFVDGNQYASRAFLLSHPLISASRFYKGREVLTDQLTDGTLAVLVDSDEPSGELLDAMTLFADVWNRGGDL